MPEVELIKRGGGSFREIKGFFEGFWRVFVIFEEVRLYSLKLLLKCGEVRAIAVG